MLSYSAIVLFSNVSLTCQLFFVTYFMCVQRPRSVIRFRTLVGGNHHVANATPFFVVQADL